MIIVRYNGVYFGSRDVFGMIRQFHYKFSKKELDYLLFQLDNYLEKQKYGDVILSSYNMDMKKITRITKKSYYSCIYYKCAEILGLSFPISGSFLIYQKTNPLKYAFVGITNIIHLN